MKRAHSSGVLTPQGSRIHVAGDPYRTPGKVDSMEECARCHLTMLLSRRVGAEVLCLSCHRSFFTRQIKEPTK